MKHRLRSALTATALALTLGMMASVAAHGSKKVNASKLVKASKITKVSKAQASHVVGMDLAKSLPPVVREEIDPAIVARTVKAVLMGKKSRMSDARYRKVKLAFIKQLQAKLKARFDKKAAKNAALGKAFLAKNRKVRGVKVTASGLQYQVLSRGHGPHPKVTDTVKVKYVGKLLSGKVFDDSSKHPGGGLVSIPLANVIPGFREGLQLMHVGAHYKLFIPGNLAYGARPGGQLPPNSTLIFDVTLSSIVPAKAPAKHSK